MARTTDRRSHLGATASIQDYPEFQLKDELFHPGEGSVVNSFGKQYTRRKKPTGAAKPISG
jgi:hypothetical protein